MRCVRCGYVDRRCTTGWHDETHCWAALHAACPGDREARWRGWRACAHSSSSRVASGEPPVGSSPPLAGQGNRKRPVDDSPTGGSAEHHSSISTIVGPFHTSVTPASPGRYRVRLSGRAAGKVGPTRAKKAELREVRPANAIRSVLAAGREKFSRIDCNSLSYSLVLMIISSAVPRDTRLIDRLPARTLLPCSSFLLCGDYPLRVAVLTRHARIPAKVCSCSSS